MRNYKIIGLPILFQGHKQSVIKVKSVISLFLIVMTTYENSRSRTT